MGRIPIHRFRFNSENDGRILFGPNSLQLSYIDFRNQLQPPLRGFLDKLSEQIPVVS